MCRERVQEVEAGVVEDLDGAVALGDEKVLGRVSVGEGRLVGLLCLLVAA